jgi:1-acyl-sn-glycerol-3-phosphate acyltransferase
MLTCLFFSVEVNTIFLVVLPILYPINPSWWRAFAEAFMDRVWSAIPWGMEYFGGNKVHWYGTKVPEREKAIVLTNHTHYCDWMICFALAVRARLGACLASSASISLPAGFSFSLLSFQFTLMNCF